MISLVALVVGVQLALLTLAGQQAGAEGLSADRCPQGIGPIGRRPNEIRIVIGGNDRQRIAAGGRHRVRLNSANQPNQILQLFSGKSINYN